MEPTERPSGGDDPTSSAPADSSPDPADVETGEAAGRWRILTLIPNDGREPPANQSAAEAHAVWATVTAAWHPAILACCSDLPGIECVDYPDHPYPHEIRIIAAGSEARLPSDYRVLVANVGGMLLDGSSDRAAIVRRLAGGLPGVEPPFTLSDPTVSRFLALGAAWWWLRDLTIAMGHPDCLDHESLKREVLTGARAWRNGDLPTAENRLRAAFELLTQTRERFYPVDAAILDICLLDPTTPEGALADALDARVPVTFLAPARSIEILARRDPERLQALRAAIDEGWADVIGGTYGEADDPLRPIESVLWQFRRGGETYRKYLDDRTTETLARRRFGLYPMAPQIARRHGFRFAMHLGFDSGIFPVPPEVKRLWDAPDGSQLEALTRPPIAANSDVEATRLPWRLAKSMKEDHVATIGLIHWPLDVADWYRDLRTIAACSPVLARWMTANDYFHRTDRPYETFRPTLDQYVFPYLIQSVERREPRPVSRRVLQTRLRARLDGMSTLEAIHEMLTASVGVGANPQSASSLASVDRPAVEPEAEPTGHASEDAIISERTERRSTPRSEAEDHLESGRLDEAAAILDSRSVTATSIADLVLGMGSGDRPGYLVLNPYGIERRASVLLPDAAPDLRPEGPLLAAQFTDVGVRAIVDLPAFGYAWVPRDARIDQETSPAGALGARGRTLFNDRIEVEIDESTGGIRSLRAPGESFARLGQQLVITGLQTADGSPGHSRMRCERFDVEYGGPALAQAVSEGVLADPADGRTLARFRQVVRLWKARPLAEIEVTLTEIDPTWPARIADADPWSKYLACRWAWPDAHASLRRTSHLAPLTTHAEHVETPDAIDITTPGTRATLLFGGLAHHRRHGERMLDTLLIVGREQERVFRLGVALDQDHPFQAACDFQSEAWVVPTRGGPPASGPVGWFLQVDHRGVAVTKVEPVASTGEGRGWGLAIHLLETAGRAARCRLRLARNPILARQADFQGVTILDLPVHDDTVSLDLTPHELARIEVTFGT